MKKILFATAALAVCLTLTACDNGNKSSDEQSSASNVSETSLSSSEKAAKMLSEIEFPDMRKLESADDLFAVVGVNASDLTEYEVYICPSGMSPDEFGILVAKDEATADSVKGVIESRIGYLNDTFRDYPLAAEQVYKLDDSFVSVNGNTVSYCISADNSKAKDILG